MTMQIEPTTSAFGRRAVTRAQIEAQRTVRLAQTAARERAAAFAGEGGAGQGAQAGHSSAVHKWTLLRTLSEIRDGLGVSDRALGVLSALMSFHPETALTLDEAGIVVYPSNKALGLRANGMSEPTLRRHLSALVEAGLIIRRDSPNGKRFARRDPDGQGAVQAFGFDLAPLVARAGEFEVRLDALRAEQRRARLLKERINLLRRDLTKRIAFALDEQLAGPWESLRKAFLSLCTPLRQLRSPADFARLASELEELHGTVTSELDRRMDQSSADDAQSERQITESTPNQIHELEPASKEDTGQTEPSCDPSAPAVRELPLPIVLDACPDIRDYAFGLEKIESWRAFVDVAASVRPMLGISPDAWREAIAVMGEKSAAIAVAFILQRCEHSSQALRQIGPDGRETVTVNASPAIRSPGGYLRALNQKAKEEPLNLWGAILGQISQKAKGGR
jgi:replication initiation protein RepC